MTFLEDSQLLLDSLLNPTEAGDDTQPLGNGEIPSHSDTHTNFIGRVM